MKPALLVALLGVNAVSAASWSPRSSVVVPSQRAKENVSRALSIRGGGVFGTPITKEFLAGLFVAEEAFGATLMIPTPVEAAASYGVEIEENSLEAFAVQVSGFSNVNVALTIFLSVFSNLSVEKIIGYAVIPCSSFMVNVAFTDRFLKLGCPKGLGTAFASLFLWCQYVIFSGNGDANLACKVLAAAHLLMGFSGYLFPKESAKMLGVELNDKQAVYWRGPYSGILLVIGVMHSLLLKGESALTASAYGALVCAAEFAICLLSGEDKVVGMPKSTYYGYIAFFGIVGLGLLLK